LAGFEPDAIAQKGDEKVVIKVVSRDELRKREHHLGYWLGKVNSEPGWRFDLIITNPSPWPDTISRNAHDFEIGDVRDRNLEARRILAQGFVEPACLFAWALVEASLRLVARSLEIPLADKSPSFVIKQLYTVGVISAEEFGRLQRSLAIRNSVAHGMKTPDLDEDEIAEVMAMTDKFLSVAEAQHRMAGA
jgi:hypothetical protein